MSCPQQLTTAEDVLTHQAGGGVQLTTVDTTPCQQQLQVLTTLRETKVCDKKGNPLIVFHGSDQKEIPHFDRFGSIGTFFCQDRQLAQNYAGQQGAVYARYLLIKKPLIWDYETTARFQDWLLEWLLNDGEVTWQMCEDFDRYRERHELDYYNQGEEGLQQAIEEILKFHPQQVDFREMDVLGSLIRQFAQEQGHDGIFRYYDLGEGYRSDFFEYIAFEDEQIMPAFNQ